ncbi:hypothetical protein ACFSCZ_01400 [Siminovitchia sediminis]|uniref:Uncharacterized protein n=1 Tax=Siminovitchia sediminis TaxID=1274353 RepID=A0ABW4KBP7_9BACI
MGKFISNIILPMAAIALLYRWRYKILNLVLSNDSIRKLSVDAVMRVPGVRSGLFSKAFRS